MKRILIGVVLVIMTMALVVPVVPVCAEDGVDWLILQKRYIDASEATQQEEATQKGTIPFDQLFVKEDLKKKNKIPFDQLYVKNDSKKVGAPAPVSSVVPGTVYVVVEDDTVSKIFARFCDKGHWKTISADNNLDQNNTIYVGQKLMLRESLLKKDYQDPMLKLEQAGKKIASLNVEVKNLGGKVKKISEELAEKKVESSEFKQRALQAEKNLEGFRNKVVEIVSREFPGLELDPSRSLEEFASFLQASFISLNDKAQELQDSMNRRKILGWVAIFIIIFLIVLVFLTARKLIRAVKENTELRTLMSKTRIIVKFNHDGVQYVYGYYCTKGTSEKYDLAPLKWSGETVVKNKDVAENALSFYLKMHLSRSNEASVEKLIDRLFATGQLVKLDEEVELVHKTDSDATSGTDK